MLKKNEVYIETNVTLIFSHSFLTRTRRTIGTSYIKFKKAFVT